MSFSAILLLLQGLTPAVNGLLGWYFKLVNTAKQIAEKTPEEEAALDAEVGKLKINAEVWQQEQPL